MKRFADDTNSTIRGVYVKKSFELKCVRKTSIRRELVTDSAMKYGPLQILEIANIKRKFILQNFIGAVHNRRRLYNWAVNMSCLACLSRHLCNNLFWEGYAASID